MKKNKFRWILLGIAMIVMMGNLSLSASSTRLDTKERLIRKIHRLAQIGEGINSHPFHVGSTKDQIENAWGFGDANEEGLPCVYNVRKVKFDIDIEGHVGPANEAREVVYFGEDLHRIRVQDIMDELGDPNVLDDRWLNYQVGEYDLYFEFSTNMELERVRVAGYF